MKGVLLLRSPSADIEDSYESVIREKGFRAVSVPVLETVFKNVDTLTDILHKGPKDFLGVIVTSARACEVWRNAVRTTDGHTSWRHVPFYTVGPSTAAALSSIASDYPESEYVPRVIRGESSGTGEQLAQFILEDVKERGTLLYLTGDKNRETIPSILEAGGMRLHALGTYSTGPSPNIKPNLERILKDSAFFAPSSAGYAVSALSERFNLDGLKPSLLPCKIASIGPTTTAYITDTLKLRVDATADKPSPDSLLGAILK